MRISKKLLLPLSLLLLAAFLGACNNDAKTNSTVATTEQTAAPKDFSQLAGELIDAGCFKDQMDTTTYVEMLLGISESEYSSVIFYVGSGATSERLAVFEVKSQAEAEAIKAKCESHLSEIKENYASYMPDEVDKISHGIIASDDKHVILCVASRYDEAKNIIDSYFAQ